jgi:16S rRNA processing protein RimM
VSLDDLIAIARVVKTRGIRGEVAADLLRISGAVRGLETLVAISPDGSRRSLAIEEYWFHGNRVVLKFPGYDSIDAAKELVGWSWQCPRKNASSCRKINSYEWELVGCRVETTDEKIVGHVKGIMRTGGVEILVVSDDAGREFLVPMASDICVKVDVEQKFIQIDPPEGLLEL